LKKFEEELEHYRKDGKYNVLVPTVTIQEISPFHKPVLEIVRIDPNPENKEVYQVILGSDDFSLSAVALNKIGYAAGLIWNARGCHRTDDGSNPNIVTYKAEAAVRKEDGSYMPVNAEYMLDLEVAEQEMRESYDKKFSVLVKKGETKESGRKDYVEKNVKRDLLQKRKFRLQLAQTGAMDRVIRKILGLKGTYKKAELEKPFIVPKIAFAPDISDPKVREVLLRQGLDATNILFGPHEPGLIEHISKAEESVIDVTPPVTGGEKEEAPLEEKPFDKMTEEEQIIHLKGLMGKKGYPETNLKRPFGEWTAKHREDFLTKLQSLPDKEELPFG
jgi:hypothetical protein